RFLHDACLSDRRYEQARDMLQIDEGTTPLGHSLLRVTFPFTGSVTTQEWDGTEEDAEAMIDSVAEALAEDVEADRPVFGPTGWESDPDVS
ncbi:MAG TPA: hypothetical protein VG795_09155, partial [Acidimicrobiia bacterium]|nr:hypothetical protein [Acidimicrobiia bacterium]